jgi:catechol 2,3-dioxygenase-like lactoylglutathione lyase family enzyme
MSVLGIDHINIDTVKPSETIAFYTDVLGLENRPDQRPGDMGDGAWLFCGDTAVVHLNFHDAESDAAERLERGTRSGAFNHIAFAGTDFDGTCATLDRLGLSYRSNDRPEIALKQIFVQDPNGVAVEINING